jgi:prepilin-type N-terminal cleavage/methylation domain-containing protein
VEVAMTSSSSRFGFSLLELMIVLAILVTITAIAVPNLWRSFQRNELRESTRLLQEAVGEIRMDAMRQGRPIWIQFGWNSAAIRVLRDTRWAETWTTLPITTANSGFGVGAAEADTSAGSSNQLDMPFPSESSSEFGNPAANGVAENLGNTDLQSQLIEVPTVATLHPRRLTSEDVLIASADTSTATEPGVSFADTATAEGGGAELEATSRNGERDRNGPESSGLMQPTFDNRAIEWSRPVMISTTGQGDEIVFWIQVDRQWQAPVLLRGATGQLELGPAEPVERVTDAMEQEPGENETTPNTRLSPNEPRSRFQTSQRDSRAQAAQGPISRAWTLVVIVLAPHETQATQC